MKLTYISLQKQRKTHTTYLKSNLYAELAQVATMEKNPSEQSNHDKFLLYKSRLILWSLGE